MALSTSELVTDISSKPSATGSPAPFLHRPPSPRLDLNPGCCERYRPGPRTQFDEPFSCSQTDTQVTVGCGHRKAYLYRTASTKAWLCLHQSSSSKACPV